MNTIVTFENAKSLKEKGFDDLCTAYYNQALFEGKNPDWEGVFPKFTVFKRHDTHFNSKPIINDQWFDCSAPTISEVVMWLYEKHGIWVVVNISIDNTWYFEFFNLKDKRNAEIEVRYEIAGRHKSPEEAYQEAIKYTLENLI